MLSCTSGQTAPFITDSRVALSVTFARALTLAQTSDRCPCACAAWLKMSTMNAFSLAHLACSGSCRKNSWPDGNSSGGSTTSTPPPVRCCHKYTAVGSLMVLRMTSTLVSPMLSHCLATIFLKFWIVCANAVFVSWWIKVERWSKTLLIFSVYRSASSGFWTPTSGHSSSSSSSTKSITGSSLPPYLLMFWIRT